MTIDNAIDMVRSEYEKALNLSYIRNPLAFALYSVWKKADKVKPHCGAKMDWSDTE